MVGQGGLEPPTPRLSSVCSNQLSYWPQSSPTNRKDPTKGPLQAGSTPKAGAPRPGSSQPVNTCISSQIPEPGYAVSAQASSRSPPASPSHPAQRHDVFLQSSVVTSQFVSQPTPHPKHEPNQPGRHEQASYVVGTQQSRQAETHQHHQISLKGGDPAAGSPTATLLRLHPSR